MRKCTAFALVLGVGLLALTGASTLGAGDKKSKGPPALPPPGPEHKLLKQLAGTFDANVTFIGGDGKKNESKGVMKRAMILGGRILHEDYDGSFAGLPFKGLGMTGYDTFSKKFTSVWADSMTNSIMTSEGTYDANTKTYHYVGQDADPYTGKKMKARDTLKVVSPDEQILEMYRQPAGGKEVKMLEIRYVRKK